MAATSQTSSSMLSSFFGYLSDKIFGSSPSSSSDKVQQAGSFIFRTHSERGSQLIPQRKFTLYNRHSTLKNNPNAPISMCKRMKRIPVSEALQILTISRIFHAQPTEVKYIDFSTHPKLTDEEFCDFIQNHPDIEGINVSGCYLLTDKAFASLNTLQKLKFLSCPEFSKITPDGFKQIPMQNMVALSLRENKIPAELIPELFSEAPHLRYLDLFSTCQNLDNQSLEALSKITTLEHLDLSLCNYLGGKQGIIALGNLTQLVSFGSFFYQQRVENQYFQILENMKNLKQLRLLNVLHPTSSFPNLAQLSLSELDLESNTDITMSLQNLPETLTSLKFISTMNPASEEFYSSIGRLTQLENLTLSPTLDGDLIQKYWSNITHLKKISILNGTNNPLNPICDNNRELQNITANGITDDTISHLLNLPHLKTLNFFSSICTPQILFAELAKQESPPRLKTVMIDTIDRNCTAEEFWTSLLPFARSLESVIANGIIPDVVDEEQFVKTLIQFTNLNDTKVYYSISSEAYKTIFTHLKKMKSLMFQGRKQDVTHQTYSPVFEGLGTMPDLEMLNMHNLSAQNSDFEKLSQTSLKFFDLNGVGGFNDDAVPSLEQLKSMISFSIEYTGEKPPLSESAMKILNDSLQLQSCSEVSLP